MIKNLSFISIHEIETLVFNIMTLRYFADLGSRLLRYTVFQSVRQSGGQGTISKDRTCQVLGFKCLSMLSHKKNPDSVLLKDLCL